MLRQAQHERKILNNFSAKPVRPEPFDKPVLSLSKGERRYAEAQRLVEDVRTFFQPLRK